MGCRLVPKSVILNDLERRNGRVVSRVALVASRWEDPVQAVHTSSQVASGTQRRNISQTFWHRLSVPGRSSLRASSCGNLVVPRTRPSRQRIADRAFSVAALRAWNRLPTELKLLRSTDSLRRDMKTFLFHSVYGHQDTDAPSVF